MRQLLRRRAAAADLQRRHRVESVVPVLKLYNVHSLIKAAGDHLHADLRTAGMPRGRRLSSGSVLRGFCAQVTPLNPASTHLLVVLGAPPLVEFFPPGCLPQLLCCDWVAVQAQCGQRRAASQYGRRHRPQPAGGERSDGRAGNWCAAGPGLRCLTRLQRLLPRRLAPIPTRDPPRIPPTYCCPAAAASGWQAGPAALVAQPGHCPAHPAPAGHCSRPAPPAARPAGCRASSAHAAGAARRCSPAGCLRELSGRRSGGLSTVAASTASMHCCLARRGNPARPQLSHPPSLTYLVAGQAELLQTGQA